MVNRARTTTPHPLPPPPTHGFLLRLPREAGGRGCGVWGMGGAELPPSPKKTLPAPCRIRSQGNHPTSRGSPSRSLRAAPWKGGVLREGQGRGSKSMTVSQGIFLVTALVAVLAALMVVATPRLVHAALWLVVTLGAVAVVFVLLDAAFLAMVQVAVYIGAIAILIIFTVMLTRRVMGDSGPQA